MITVAGVTFSMTLLAVSHATSHIGAHLLSAFMRDRGNQLTLGTFIATFLYCLMLLRSIHSADESSSGTAMEFVPHIAVNGALVLAILSVVVLIYFIHHVPQSMNVANVTARVGDDLVRCIHSLYPENLRSSPPPDEKPSLADEPEGHTETILIGDPGRYLRVIDNEALMQEACAADVVIEICKRPGDFGPESSSSLSITRPSWRQSGVRWSSTPATMASRARMSVRHWAVSSGCRSSSIVRR